MDYLNILAIYSPTIQPIYSGWHSSHKLLVHHSSSAVQDSQIEQIMKSVGQPQQLIEIWSPCQPQQLLRYGVWANLNNSEIWSLGQPQQLLRYGVWANLNNSEIWSLDQPQQLGDMESGSTSTTLRYGVWANLNNSEIWNLGQPQQLWDMKSVGQPQ